MTILLKILIVIAELAGIVWGLLALCVGIGAFLWAWDTADRRRRL